MEGKFFIYFLLLLLLIGLGYGIHQTTEIDEANKELIAVTNQIGNIETLIKNQTAYVELRREVAALLTAANIMQRDNTKLRGEVNAYRDREFQARRSFEQAIAKSRSDATGLVINDPVLPSGLRLHNARVQRVEGEITTVVHAEGISNLTPEMLPEELRERFRFRMPLESPAPVVPSADAAAGAATSPGTVPVQSKSDRLAAARLGIDRLKKGMPYLEEELKKAEAEASTASSPTKRFYGKNRVDALNKQISELKAKIEADELELKNIEAGS